MKKLLLLMLVMGMLTITFTPTKARRLPYCGDQVIGTGCDSYGHCTELVKRTCSDCDPTCNTVVSYFTRPVNN